MRISILLYLNCFDIFSSQLEFSHTFPRPQHDNSEIAHRQRSLDSSCFKEHILNTLKGQLNDDGNMNSIRERYFRKNTSKIDALTLNLVGSLLSSLTPSKPSDCLWRGKCHTLPSSPKNQIYIPRGSCVQSHRQQFLSGFLSLVC